MNSSATVSLSKSPNSYSGVTSALKLIEKEVILALKGKKRVVIKTNLVSIRHPLASTPVDSVRAVLNFLSPLISNEIIIAEGSTENTEKGFKKLGYLDLGKDYKVKFVDLNKDKVGRVIEICNAEGKPVKLGIAKTITDADFIISITRPKTHNTGVVTLSIKNLLVGSAFEKWKIHQGMKFHWNLLSLAKVIKPHLSIIDGTTSMEGEGPAFGTPKRTNFAAAGLDPLAVDSLVTKLMGFNLKDVGYLKLMADNRLGVGDLSKVVIAGERPEKFQYRFKPHPTHKRQILWQDINLPQKTLISKILGLTLGKAKVIIPGKLIIEMQEIGPLRQFVTRIQNGF